MNTAITNTFSIERITHLCKRYITIKKNMIMIGLAAMATIIAFTKSIDLFYIDLNPNTLPGIFMIAFVIFKYAGYAFTSTMFNELNLAGVAPQFYTLPATDFEKLTSAWLISFVCYTVVGLTALYILSLLLGMNGSWFFNADTLNELWTYTIVQSIFLFGAVYFKVNNFLSTVVAMLGAMISLALLFLLFNHLFEGFEAWVQSIPALIFTSAATNLISSLMFTLTVSAIFIWFAYLRLKNRQIA